MDREREREGERGREREREARRVNYGICALKKGREILGNYPLIIV